MRLRSCLKRYKKDTHRALPPEETLEIVERKMPAAGITRVADITNLDRIGIPVFTSIRPTAEKGAISVYNGKGATPTEAKVSAIMEGIERYSAELRNSDLRIARFSELRDNALDPAELILPRGVDPDAEIPWVMGYDLIGDEEILVPANAVFHPLPSSYTRLFRTNTTGLASGNQLEEAIFHGLAEVVERDAWSIAEHARRMGPLLRYNGDGLAGELLEMFQRAEVQVYVRDITSDVDVPTFAAVSDDLKLKDPALLTAGMGTHTDPEVALLRALTEVAQSRLTQIHGAREDTVSADFRRMMGYDRLKRLNRHWFEHEHEEDFSSIKSYDTDDFLDDIRHMLDRLQAAGFERAIVVDLTAPEIMVPVVRVIVPGLEISAVDPERVGKRCRNAKDRRVSGPKHAS
ncbi:MAG: YcaO-related McrA-glycine thioamidation protein [Methanothrix sp.]|uniref:YcaO-related McrA-glycine thioamidation protein n=1 Tax=Methanothrix sp. TaxID=90426 RepID=UPI0025CE4B6E|nr:YcaO-related McrA-glycine thioamidation protein [Methanothrix sp.]MCQ8903229.1 YcaO-related McrA-glycine thioamidation protein [Methanothrix sp.]